MIAGTVLFFEDLGTVIFGVRVLGMDIAAYEGMYLLAANLVMMLAVGWLLRASSSMLRSLSASASTAPRLLTSSPNPKPTCRSVRSTTRRPSCRTIVHRGPRLLPAPTSKLATSDQRYVVRPPIPARTPSGPAKTRCHSS